MNREEERALVLSQAAAAKQAARQLVGLTTAQKNTVLQDAAAALVAASEQILAANHEDLAAGKAAGMDDSLLDRLALSAERIAGIASGLTQVAQLPDPVGRVLAERTLPNGLQLEKISTPFGVMGMVYEARPNVTVDAFGLALKSGNAALLRGSKSAWHSNQALVAVLQDVLAAHDLPRTAVQLLPCETHDSVQDLITARGLVDVVIPRGSARLINAVVAGATVPAIETGTGNCHLYIHRDADLEQAIEILINGKTRRCSVCNTTETVLLDEGLAAEQKLAVFSALVAAGVTVHGEVAQLDEFGAAGVVPATDWDWANEYLSLDIAMAVVPGLEGALEHIATWSSGHTDAICTTDQEVARKFALAVDSAVVNINASTAFTDGEQFGMGAEIGISTQKLHARGPMALPELTTYKWIVTGNGQVRP